MFNMEISSADTHTFSSATPNNRFMIILNQNELKAFISSGTPQGKSGSAVYFDKIPLGLTSIWTRWVGCVWYE